MAQSSTAKDAKVTKEQAQLHRQTAKDAKDISRNQRARRKRAKGGIQAVLSASKFPNQKIVASLGVVFASLLFDM